MQQVNFKNITEWKKKMHVVEHFMQCTILIKYIYIHTYTKQLCARMEINYNTMNTSSSDFYLWHKTSSMKEDIYWSVF